MILAVQPFGVKVGSWHLVLLCLLNYVYLVLDVHLVLAVHLVLLCLLHLVHLVPDDALGAIL